MIIEGTELDSTNTDSQDNTDLNQDDGTNTDQNQTVNKSKEDKEFEIVNAKQKQIDNGEIRRSELAPWLQERTTDKIDNQETEESMEERISKRIRSEMEFDKLKETIPANTSKEDIDKLNKIMEDPELQNLSQSRRLKIAMAETGISLDKQKEVQKGIEIGRGRIMPSSDYSRENTFKTEEEKIVDKYMNNLPEEYRK